MILWQFINLKFVGPSDLKLNNEYRLKMNYVQHPFAGLAVAAFGPNLN